MIQKQLEKSAKGNIFVEYQEKSTLLIDENYKEFFCTLNPWYWRRIINFKKDFPTAFIVMDEITIGIFMDRENIITYNDKYFHIRSSEYIKLKEITEKPEGNNIEKHN